MAKKVIGFSIDIEGIDSINRLKEEIKATEKELGGLTKGTDEYTATAQKLAKLKAAQQEVRKEQADLVKSFRETSDATKPYDQLKLKLERLRTEYKNLAAAGQESTEEAQDLARQIGEVDTQIKQINKSAKGLPGPYVQLSQRLGKLRSQYKDLAAAGKANTAEAQDLLATVKRLDTELKNIDASTGLYQRNVGNYAGGFKEALGEFAGGLGELGGLVNPATLGVGAAIAGAQALAQEVLNIEKQFADLGRVATQVTGLTGQALDELVVNTQALSTTFGEESQALIQAQNTLIKEFGLSSQEAFDIVQTGLASSANASGDFLDSVREYSTQIREAGGSATQLVSILAKSGQEGVFSDKGVDAVKEFGLRIRAEGDAARTVLADNFGAGFADEITKGVRTGSITTLDALQKVSARIDEIGDQTRKQELISNLFGGAGEDAGARFLATLGSIDTELGKVLDKTNPYVKAQQDLLAANKELAEAQKEVAEEFSGANSGIATLTARVKAFSIRVLLASFKALVLALKPVTDLFISIGQQTVDFVERLVGFESAADSLGGTLQGFFNNMAKYLLTPLRTAAVLIQGAIDIFFALAGAVLDFVQLIPGVGEGLKFLIDLYFEFAKAFSQLPAVAAGVIEVIKQIGREFVRFFELAILDAQIFAARAKGIFSEAAAAQVAALRAQRAAVKAEAVGIAEAFSKGFNAQLKKDQEAEAEQQRRVAVQAEEAKQAEVSKAAAKAREARIKDSQKELEAQKKFAEEEAAFFQKQANILLKIQERNTKLRLGQIADAQERERALAQAASQERIEQARAEVAKLQAQQEARETEAAKVFGADSAKLRELQTANASQLEQANAALANTILREQQNLTDDLLAIDAKFSQERIEQQEAAASEQLRKLELNAQLQTLEVERAEADGVLAEKDAAAEKLAIQEQLLKDKLALFEQELMAKQRLANAGVEVDQKAIDELRLKIAETRTAISQLGQQGEEEGSGTTKKTVEQIVGDYADATQQASSILSDFFNASQERLRNQVAAQQEANQLERQQLEEQLQSATGLERRYLQQRIEANTAAAERIAKEEERIAKRQAKADKARAITESIVNTAVAVTKVIANPIAAIAVGIAGAAQTALIAAQKFATGGVVGKGNIPAQPNGDNVLATVKTGEVVLTETQQAALGGAPALAAAGVPGFADGGLVGSAIPSNVRVAQTSSSNLDTINQNLLAAIEATNRRIDRQVVVYDASTQDAQDRQQQDRKQIQRDASF